MLDLHVTCEYSFFFLNYGTKPIYCLTCFIEHSESERFQWITVKILGFSRQNTLYRNSEISSYEDFLTLKNIFFYYLLFKVNVLYDVIFYIQWKNVNSFIYWRILRKSYFKRVLHHRNVKKWMRIFFSSQIFQNARFSKAK